jgi:hypothetical protein
MLLKIKYNFNFSFVEVYQKLEEMTRAQTERIINENKVKSK